MEVGGYARGGAYAFEVAGFAGSNFFVRFAEGVILHVYVFEAVSEHRDGQYPEAVANQAKCRKGTEL